MSTNNAKKAVEHAHDAIRMYLDAHRAEATYSGSDTRIRQAIDLSREILQEALIAVLDLLVMESTVGTTVTLKIELPVMREADEKALRQLINGSRRSPLVYRLYDSVIGDEEEGTPVVLMRSVLGPHNRYATPSWCVVAEPSRYFDVRRNIDDNYLIIDVTQIPCEKCKELKQ